MYNFVERQFIADHTQAGSWQFPSGLQIFENLRHGSQLPNDVQEIVDRHVGQRHTQILQRQLVSDLVKINGTPRFHQRNSVDYVGKSADWNPASAWVVTPLRTVVWLSD